MRYAKIFKAGNAEAICLGKEEISALELKAGDYIKMDIVDGKLVIEKAK